MYMPHKNSIVRAALAQLVEQGTENPCVLGSIPRRGTTFLCKNNYYLKVLKIAKVSLISDVLLSRTLSQNDT